MYLLVRFSVIVGIVCACHGSDVARRARAGTIKTTRVGTLRMSTYIKFLYLQMDIGQ